MNDSRFRPFVRVPAMAAVVVLAAWISSIAVAVSVVGHFGLSTPYWDDWNYIPFAVGRVPITWDWLWAFQNDHRIPLPKVLFVFLFRLGQGDVRVVMFANLAILSLVSLLGIVVVRRRRGFTRFSDILIPLAVVASPTTRISSRRIRFSTSCRSDCSAWRWA